MKLLDLAHSDLLALTNKAVESFFETRIDLSAMSPAQSAVMLEQVQQILTSVRRGHNVHSSEQNPRYLRAMMLEQALLSKLSETTVGTTGSVGTTGTAPAQTQIAGTPVPKASVIQQKAQMTKDPKTKDMLNKAAKGQNMTPDEVKRLASFAADANVNEGKPERKAELGQLMSKLSQVINSVKTIDQHRAAEKYANLVINKVRDRVNADRGFAGISEVQDYLRAINRDLRNKLREITSGHQMNENKEYSIKYVQEDDVWTVVDSVGNRIESFIDKHEAVQAARKLNSGSAKAPNRHRHVNYRGDLEEGKLDDLKDKKAEKDDWFDAKPKQEPAKKKVAGKQYGGSKQKDEVSESAILRKVATAKLVEFYRKHRASGSARVKMVESELFRRKMVLEARKTNRQLVTEGEVQQAQVVLAAQDMVDQIQKMIEQASGAQFKDLPALVSQIRLDQGPEQSAQFNQAVTAAMTSLLQALASAKEQMEGAVDVVTGNAPAGPTINAGDDAAPADVPPVAGDDAAADDLDLDKETGDITGFGRERR